MVFEAYTKNDNTDKTTKKDSPDKNIGLSYVGHWH